MIATLTATSKRFGFLPSSGECSPKAKCALHAHHAIYPPSLRPLGLSLANEHLGRQSALPLAYTKDKSLLLTMPLEYLKEAQAGDVVRLGLIDSTCISLIK